MRRRSALQGGLVTLVTVGAVTMSLSTPQQSRPPATAQAPAILAHTHVVTVDRKLAMTVTAPDTVQPGAAFTVRGTVKVRKKKPRKLVVHQRQGSGWAKLASQRSTKKGGFAFKLRAGTTELTQLLRVTAPKAKRLAKLQQRLRVVIAAPLTPDPPDPTPTSTPEPEPEPEDPPPLGSSADWSWAHPDGVRWDPCTPILWSYATSGEPYAAVADVTRAFDRIAERTGLEFVHTDSSATSDISVRWSSELLDSGLIGRIVGYARWWAFGLVGKDVGWQLTSADIVLDKGFRMRSGHHTSGDPSWGQVMTHEIAHATGLSHAGGQRQLMYPSANSLNHRLGAGDVAGLTAVGATRGCL